MESKWIDNIPKELEDYFEAEEVKTELPPPPAIVYCPF